MLISNEITCNELDRIFCKSYDWNGVKARVNDSTDHAFFLDIMTN